MGQPQHDAHFTLEEVTALWAPKPFGRLEKMNILYRRIQSVDKFLALPERKQATATEDFEFHISYL